MSMEIMLRYIVGIAIAYGIGKWIYQSIRSRSIDFFFIGDYRAYGCSFMAFKRVSYLQPCI